MTWGWRQMLPSGAILTFWHFFTQMSTSVRLWHEEQPCLSDSSLPNPYSPSKEEALGCTGIRRAVHTSLIDVHLHHDNRCLSTSMMELCSEALCAEGLCSKKVYAQTRCIMSQSGKHFRKLESEVNNQLYAKQINLLIFFKPALSYHI